MHIEDEAGIILLTNGKVTIVDMADYERLSVHKWMARKDPRTGKFYVIRTGTMLDGPRWRRTILMHREILGLENSWLRGDHINHDTLDNRQSNLRVATPAQNRHNSSAPNRNNTSGFTGVQFRHECTLRPWKAGIFFQGKYRLVGYFSSPKEAAEARDQKAIELHGDFARRTTC